MEIDISVIIPVYNTELYLERCLASILSQNLNNIEIEVIIINDGSTDSSATIIDDFKRSDPRVIIYNQKNHGAWAARNKGITLAKGEYLVFVDSDDDISPNMLKDLYCQASEQSSDIVVSMYKRISDTGKVSSISRTCVSKNKEAIFQDILTSNILPTVWSKLIRRSIFIENNIYFPELDYFEDIIVAIKLFYFAQSISIVNIPYYNWHIRDGSATRQSSLEHISDKFLMLDSIKNFLIEQKIYIKYKAEYLCQCAKRIISEINVVNLFADDRSNDMLGIIFNEMETRQLMDKENLQLLNQYDNELYKNLKYNIIDKTSYINLSREALEKKFETCSILLLKSEMELEALQTFKGFRFLSESEKAPLQKLKNKFNNKRCFILGNGPSLNQCDLMLLKNEFTFASNGIIANISSDGFTPYFYVADDEFIINSLSGHIKCSSIPYKFLPSIYIDKMEKNDKLIYFTEDFGFKQKNHPDYAHPRFSKNCTDSLYSGASVNHLCLQLAFYLGFHEIYLIGMDFTFDMANLSINQIIRNDSIDDIINDFSLAKETFENSGKRIYNASKGGNINLFNRVDFDTLFF
ncbi:glycosyltransferase [sulfur-oxidizing endosymbiont of Gigantopelta aegis]|uniref:glycosyltransferase n=1 Tax=sulfur-oxidizing endosymbiont of Gigantopelta aegis TaxID=2794934 RepID=UPI0018DBCC26|nr:glycosyltransferase [sulfur-oxidizing endosymbiont of Gigantopelta aegis]